VRDPNPPQVEARIATLRLPHDPSVLPEGIKPIDCRSLSLLRHQSNHSRAFLFATPAPSRSELMEAYGLTGVDCAFLPNIVDIRANKVIKSETPRVIFLTRLDPIKRPWLFVELAKIFPQVEFLLLGKAHFHGPGTWAPTGLPRNVTVLGHIDGERKVHLLSTAWVLVNTSIHEGLATSFLEALACETPLLSCTNVEGVASRFGIFAGMWDGDGMAGLPALTRGLQHLLADERLRTELGRKGRQWVEETHSASRFLSAFNVLCDRAGVHRRLRLAELQSCL
jgi:glycosyltransferase involved in cell wall biosynthesis